VSPAVVRPRARLADPRLALPVLAGTGALLLRVVILETPDITRAALLATVFTAILVASLLVPMARDVARLATGPVILVGLVGVALAAVAAGAPVPASFGTAGLPLAILAAVAEEALFRRAAYGWLAQRGQAAAVIGSALLFAAIHIPLYGAAAFPVDVGAGLLLSWQRWASGTWTVPAATHAAANLLAVVLR
jgi:membrane protease YdiL (CAAX protease family)